jgi:hypothetical protein
LSEGGRLLYLSSIPIQLFLLLLVTVIGRRIADLLPDPLKGSAGFYIAPLLGLAVLVPVVTVYGWLSPFKTGISLSLVVGLLLVGFAFEKQRVDLFRDWLIVSAFVMVATIPILAPAIRFDSFNPFNDTFTYLVHGQWLQQHAFSEVARASGFFPAESQVFLYQIEGHRMGGSFFLGFVQSLFHLEWSYYAFLPTVGLVFALGSLAIGGVIQQVVPVSRALGLALSTLPAFTMNGFVYGAQGGFFPQTFGLAFAAGLACLVPGLIAHTLSSRPAWAKQFFYLLPLAICGAAFLITYNDMFPVMGAGIGLFLLVTCALHWRERNRILGSVLMMAVQVAAVVNIEGVRILRNFVETILNTAAGEMRFGWPVIWSPVQYVAHSFGMKLPFAAHVFGADTLISSWIFPALLLGVVIILLNIVRKSPWDPTILFLLCINLVLWLVFAKFRYATPGLEGEIGYTFLQFKIAKWVSPFNLGLLAIAIAWLLVNVGKYKRICKYTFVTAFVAGMAVQCLPLAQAFTWHFQDETMQKRSPFNVYLELRSRVANIPKDQVIYLEIPFEHYKVTEMVSYVLSDRKLAGKYEDGYFTKSIPEHERDMPAETADWIIQLKRVPEADENPLDRVGPFLIRRAPASPLVK